MLFFEAGFVSTFLPLALIGFFLVQMTGHRLAISLWLIAASLVFYAAARFDYVLILVGSVTANFFLAGWILQDPGSRNSRLILTAAILANLALLGVYKYLGALTFTLGSITSIGLPDPGLLLPLAISFFTFQQIAYLVDCQRGRIAPAAHSFPDYMLFMIFFPQLVAGPVLRYQEFIPQFKRPKSVDRRFVMFAEGLFLFACGLFKKLVIADSLAPLANAGFALTDAGSTIDMASAWVSLVAFSFQLYFDFSAYCDMAIGIAMMFGIRLPWNFDSPYKSANIRDFWLQWHMTLTRWFRDYVYQPLGGKQKGLLRYHLNLIVVMLLYGLWHGPGWNFVIWGAMHAAFLIVHWSARTAIRALDMADLLAAIPNFRLAAVTTTFLSVSVAWVFFRSATTDGAMTMLASLFAAAEPSKSIGVTAENIMLMLVIAFVTFKMPNSRQISEKVSTGFSTGRFAFHGRILAGGAAGFAAAAAFIMAQNAILSPFVYFSF